LDVGSSLVRLIGYAWLRLFTDCAKFRPGFSVFFSSAPGLNGSQPSAALWPPMISFPTPPLFGGGSWRTSDCRSTFPGFCTFFLETEYECPLVRLLFPYVFQLKLSAVKGPLPLTCYATRRDFPVHSRSFFLLSLTAFCAHASKLFSMSSSTTPPSPRSSFLMPRHGRIRRRYLLHDVFGEFLFSSQTAAKSNAVSKSAALQFSFCLLPPHLPFSPAPHFGLLIHAPTDVSPLVSNVKPLSPRSPSLQFPDGLHSRIFSILLPSWLSRPSHLP